MQTICVVSQKGGASKTTVACALAVEAEKAGVSELVDIDPQRSASHWARLREAATPGVTQTAPDRLVDVLRAALNAGADLAIVDTAPHAADAAHAAAEIGDLAIVPCRASAADLAAIGAAIAITKKTKTVTVLCTAPVRNPLIDQARAAIAGYQIETAPVVLHQRIDHVHAFTGGLVASEFAPAGKASAEIAALWEWVARKLEDEGDDNG